MTAKRPFARKPILERLEDRLAPANDLFAVTALAGEAAGAAAQVRFEWGSSKAGFANEIGAFAVDDADGRVAGLLPSDPGYAGAALAGSQVIFATGTKQGAKTVREFQPGQLLGLYLVANGNTAQALAGQRPIFFTFDGANSDGVDHARARFRGDGGLDFRFEDMPGGGDLDYNDAVIGVTRTQAILTPGQPGQTVVANFTKVANNAGYKNEVGLVRVDGPDGNVGGVKPGDPGYLRAAFGDASRRLVIFSDQTMPGVNSRSLTLDAGVHYALYVVSNGSAEQALASNPDNSAAGRPLSYFSFSDANPDGLEHLDWRNGNEVGFEDLPGLGDADFDDMVIRYSFEAPLGTPTTPPTPPPPTPDTTAPTATFALTNDNGVSNTDNVTNDPELTATITEAGTVARLRAGFDSPDLTGFFDVLDQLGTDRMLKLTADLIRQINGGVDLDDGTHTLFLDAADDAGNSSVLQFTFTLDTGVPAVPTFNLDVASDTGTEGDLRTGAATVTLVGTAEAGATVELISIPRPDQGGSVIRTATVAGDGTFTFTGLPFDLGSNDLQVRVTDTAGNSSDSVVRNFVRSQAPTVQPENDLADQMVSSAAANLTFELQSVFDTVARFETSEGDIDLLLFEVEKPITVNNFLNQYVNNTNAPGNYNNTIFHRLDKDFVLQGGGFKFDPAGTTTATKFPAVVDGPMIMNEFNVGPTLSNVRGTIAMAKLPAPADGGPPNGGPDSATNEFFFNLENNAGLDGQNGGFTVFGKLTAAGQQVVDNIEATFDEFSGTGLPGAAPFPVRPGANTASFPTNITGDDLARVFEVLTLADARAFTYDVASSMPAVATADVTGSTLTIDPLTAGTTTITVTATDADESVTTITFVVTVNP